MHTDYFCTYLTQYWHSSHFYNDDHLMYFTAGFCLNKTSEMSGSGPPDVALASPLGHYSQQCKNSWQNPAEPS